MAWLYLPESVVSNSGSADGLEQSAMSREKLMLLGYLEAESRINYWMTHPSGMMSQHSTEKNGVERWTSSLEDSHAKTSRLQARDEVSKRVQDQDCGFNFSGSLMRYDQASFSWRTSQLSLTGDSILFLDSFPKQGMMLNGRIYEHQMWVRPIEGNGCSSSLGTPTATMSVRSEKFRKGRTLNPAEKAMMHTPTATGNQMSPSMVERDKGSYGKTWPTPNVADTFTDNLKSSQQKPGSMHSVTLSQKVQWPTPQSMDHRTDVRKPEERSEKANKGGCSNLREKVMYPTPTNSMMTAEDMEQSKYSGNNPDRPKYKDAKKMYPTPAASEVRQGFQDRTRGKKGTQESLTTIVVKDAGIKTPQTSTLRLNPMWVEWLMGFPKGWTELSASETEWFQDKRKRRSKS